MENPLVFIKLEDIKVEERQRQDLGDIKGLAQSLLLEGKNIVPIIIDSENNLVAGGRRYAAATMAKLSGLWAIREKDLTPERKLEYEILENTYRKDFTPAELCLATERLHEMYKKKNPGQTIEDTANQIGSSKSRVSTRLKLAKKIEEFPELKKAKTETELSQATKTLEKLQAYTPEANQVELISDRTKLYKSDCFEKMKDFEDGSFDAIITDPFYDEGFNELSINFARHGQTVIDGKDPGGKTFEKLFDEAFRITKPTGHLISFIPPAKLNLLQFLARDSGWIPYVKPLIWIKGTTGQSNAPYYWPVSCYEMILFCRKAESRLNATGRPDWIQIPTVSSKDKIHIYEKPVDLMKELVHRVVFKGCKVLDPFMGSGSTIEACVQLGIQCIGIEKDQEVFNHTNQRIKKQIIKSLTKEEK